MHRWGLPLAVLALGRGSWFGIWCLLGGWCCTCYHGGGTWRCVTSQGDQAHEAPEFPICWGECIWTLFVHLSFILSTKLCAIFDPLGALFLLGSLSDCPPFFCPRAARCGSLFSTSSWNLSLSKYSAYLSFPIPVISRAPCNVGLCSQRKSPGLGVQ